jgi:hypothetical protein
MSGTTDANNDNLAPLPCEPHPDFPGGADLTLLMDARDAVRKVIAAMGLPEIGCGVGIDGADASFRLGDRQLRVQISIFDPKE